MSIKQNPSHPLFNNYVISNIFNPEIGNATNMPDIISITNKNIDDKESTYITQAFAEIKKIDKELYDNLIKVSLFQTGVVSSPVSYYQLLPNDVLDIINSSLKKHKEAIKDFDTLVNSLMENIGGTLKNIKRVNYKKGDAEFGSIMQLPFERTQGKEFIHYVKEDKKTKTTEAEGTFRKIGEDTYALMETKNYKKIFYNLTFNAEPISLPNEENDTQEEDEDMNNQSINPEIKSSEIYNQLGNKTKSKNVEIKSWGELKNVTKAITSQGVVATRIPNTNEHFGNPFSHDPAGKTQGLIKTETVREAVEKYIDWVINSKEARAEWIREQLKSGKLKNKSIIYYKELGEPSHATALDYLINKYNWNKNQLTEIKSSSTSWNNLSLQEKIKIGKLGIKENEYSSWTEEVQESTLKCNKIR